MKNTRILVIASALYVLGALSLQACGDDSNTRRDGSGASGAGGASTPTCSVTSDCPGGQVCDPDSGECVECVRSADCESGQECSGNECVAISQGGSGG